jgi:hypothetical protein
MFGLGKNASIVEMCRVIPLRVASEAPEEYLPIISLPTAQLICIETSYGTGTNSISLSA